MTLQSKLKPRLPGGFRDYSPEEFAPRKWALDQVSAVYESYGFVPMDTSSVEYFETLSGGDDTSKQIYRIFNQSPDFSGESMALRFDLTVSLARFIAANRKAFTFPFKRYQVGEVWRGERQQRGRFKQFLQFDADIIGTAHPSADAEIVLLICQSMKALGIDNFTVKLNSRKILNGFIRSLGLSENDVNPFLRIMDKLDKVGWEGVAERLSAPKPSAEEADAGAEGMGLRNQEIERVELFLKLPPGNAERLNTVEQLGADWGGGKEGVGEIKQILGLAFAGGAEEENVKFDPSVARGLDYYTGPVFETFLNDLPDLGSVMSGGRYDNLVERFSSESIPATGISLGVDRLMVGLTELNLLQSRTKPTDYLLVGIGEGLEAYIFRVANLLRRSGATCEVYLGDNRSLKKQMTYAHRSNIKFCLIAGETEIENNTVQLKDMKSGEQSEYKLEQLPEILSF